MKDKIYIFLKNNSIIERRIKNPQEEFSVIYEIDGKNDEFIYKFNRVSTFTKKGFLGTERISFYQHGNPKPLTPDFKSCNVDMKEISHILRSNLFDQLIATTKVNPLVGSIGLWLGLAGIIAVVIIVLVS